LLGQKGRPNGRRIAMNLRSSLADCARPIVAVAVVAVLAGSLAACAGIGPTETTGSLGGGASAGLSGEDDGRRDPDAWSERYRGSPSDPQVAIHYAQSLRAAGQRAQAVAVLEQSSLLNPKDMELLGAYGRALADAGNYQQALDVLGRAHTPDRPDWRILSAQGAVLDQMGRHEEAQRYYASALRIVPDEPSILSNLGLSYALSRDLPRAEATLRRAAAGPPANPRVRQNLALVVGLQGRFAEAETIARADLPADEAAANVAYLRKMLAQQGGPPTQARVPRPAGSSSRS
jgi:Flp pilus assembly protein TadD